MNAHARYYRDCLRTALGTKEGEPLGAAYGLHRDEALEINRSARAEVARAGIKPPPEWKPSSRGSLTRLRNAYERRGLRWVDD